MTPGEAFRDAVRRRLRAAFAQIEHCLEQLEDDELHQRDFESQNSVANLLLHLAGNVRQWLISGLRQTPDTRRRALEFSERRRLPRAELVEPLRATLVEADAVLAALSDEELTAGRTIQGFDTNVTAAIVDCIAHFEGHAQEITHMTRIRRREGYRFRWKPRTADEGAPPA